jgi:hypothetical protein
MLTPKGLVKVLDFGLARLVGENGDTLTTHGSLGGTADFMAPEQAVDLHSVTIAADLYSLGCTLYYLLAGSPPFGDRRYPSFTSKLCAHRTEPVPPIAEIRPELAEHPELLRLIDRLLAKEPSSRPAEPRAVAELLERLSQGQELKKLAGAKRGAPLAPGAVLTSCVSIVRRHPRRVGLALVAAVSAGVIFGLVRWHPQRNPQGTDGASPTTRSMPAPAPSPSVPIKEALPLRIESLEVEDFRGDPPVLQGTIGVLAHAARFDDNVRVRARLSAPGYCYLIALNPDGSVQLCPKAGANSPPSLASEIDYPAEPEGYYGLTEGTGLHAFILVASRKPLPAFDSWPARSGLPWSSASAGGAWRFDGHHFAYLGSPDRSERRSPGTAPAPFADACRYLSRLPEVDTVQAMAFPVLSVEGSQTAPIPAP